MRMKTAVYRLVLLILASALLMTTAFAATDSTPGGNARYIAVATLAAGLDIDSDGKALCNGYVLANDPSYDVEIVMELLQLDTDTVKKTWTNSGSFSTRLDDKPWYVTSGHMYVVRVTASVYSGNTLIETASGFSNIVDY